MTTLTTRLRCKMPLNVRPPSLFVFVRRLISSVGHFSSDPRRTLLDCPDPKQLYHFHELKVARKQSLLYREADAVAVYNADGAVVEVDDLPQTLYAGCAVVANVVLN